MVYDAPRGSRILPALSEQDGRNIAWLNHVGCHSIIMKSVMVVRTHSTVEVALELRESKI
jgi:hypothetical protein